MRLACSRKTPFLRKGSLRDGTPIRFDRPFGVQLQPRIASTTLLGLHTPRRFPLRMKHSHVIASRLEQWDAEWARQHKESTRENSPGPCGPVRVQLGDEPSATVDLTGDEVSPLRIAKLSNAIAGHENALVAKVDGTLWDMHRPILHKPSHVHLLRYEDSHEARMVFRHSSAHLLGNAIEKISVPLNEKEEGEDNSESTAIKESDERTPSDAFAQEVHLCDGPALKDGSLAGYYYEFRPPNGVHFTSTQYPEIEKHMKRHAKSKVPFERLNVSRKFALEMFKENPFKIEMINSIPKDEDITLYRCGDFVDLCRGPHLPHTGFIKAIAVMESSGAYWKGDTTQPLLQRIYASAFPSRSLMKEHKAMRIEAARRDHRVLGQQQSLFMFHPESPGAPFFLPHGTRIFNRLTSMLKNEYKNLGYEEVITPQVFHSRTWKTSGHWENYKEDMYMVQGCTHSSEPSSPTSLDEAQWGLKPMNCPGHCLIYANAPKTYRDLPIRYADFGALHRNELSGALSGLTRVRRFHQDDAHIFCTNEQLRAEIDGCLELTRRVYKSLGFPGISKVCLSTKPESALETPEDPMLWDRAQDVLKESLEDSKLPYEINDGDGAFYGPKIDIELTDALNRSHQCATVQLDFHLPRRFGLTFQDSDGSSRTPVMVHRAVLGSVERMFAVLLEHTGGRWPFWLSPRQCTVIPLAHDHVEYARMVANALQYNCDTVDSSMGSDTFRNKAPVYHVDVDARTDLTLPKRIGIAQRLQYNFIVVVGAQEASSGTLSVRNRDTNQVEDGRSISNLLGVWDGLSKEVFV